MLKIWRLALNIPTHHTILVTHSQAKIIYRWAGHSKWANIKHQKGANDLERNKLFTKLTRMLKVAIVEGKDSDPETNSKLASVVGQCRRANMPQSNITNAIKSAAGSKSNEKTSILQIRGPGRCGLIVEISTSNLALTKNQVASVMKKHGCKYENISHDFAEKGVLIASPLPTSLKIQDDAEEHAIESGVEEVTYDEATKKLRFECSAGSTWKAKKSLESLGYAIDSAIIEYIPSNYAELDDEQIEVVEKFLQKIEAMPEVMQVTDNIA